MSFETSQQTASPSFTSLFFPSSTPHSSHDGHQESAKITPPLSHRSAIVEGPRANGTLLPTTGSPHAVEPHSPSSTSIIPALSSPIANPKSVADGPSYIPPSSRASQSQEEYMRSGTTSPSRPDTGLSTLSKPATSMLAGAPGSISPKAEREEEDSNPMDSDRVKSTTTSSVGDKSPHDEEEVLPPTPPIGRSRRIRKPHRLEPTLEAYNRSSPHTYATTHVWNERRDAPEKGAQDLPRRSSLVSSSGGSSK